LLKNSYSKSGLNWPAIKICESIFIKEKIVPYPLSGSLNSNFVKNSQNNIGCFSWHNLRADYAVIILDFYFFKNEE
jgi:hypothetical protein